MLLREGVVLAYHCHPLEPSREQMLYLLKGPPNGLRAHKQGSPSADARQ